MIASLTRRPRLWNSAPVEAIQHRRLFGSRSPLVLTRRQFEREMTRERIRATRRGVPFCTIELELRGVSVSNRATARRHARRLIDVLHRNLRVTDQKAALGRDRYAALLVDTPEMGGRIVLDRISRVTCEAGLEVDLSFHVHGDDSFDRHRDASQPMDSDGSDRDQGESLGSGSAPDESELVSLPRLAAETVEVPVAVAEYAATNLEFPILTGNRTSDRSESVGSIVAAPPEISAPKILDESLPSLSSETKPGTSESLRLPPPPASALMMSVKRGMDIAGSIVGLGLSAPLIGLAAVAIKLDDGGPVFFRQTREGRHGKLFTIYKLRTMVTNADEIKNELRDQSHRDGPAFKVKRDPRVTTVGRFLRATCLDELPQFFNVLRGDMAMVGPRPLIVPESRACNAWQRRRLDVRPGLTCTWQVNKAAAETFDDWMRMDLDYIDRMGLMRDVRLIFQTVAVQLSGRGAD